MPKIRNKLYNISSYVIQENFTQKIRQLRGGESVQQENRIMKMLYVAKHQSVGYNVCFTLAWLYSS